MSKFGVALEVLANQIKGISHKQYTVWTDGIDIEVCRVDCPRCLSEKWAAACANEALEKAALVVSRYCCGCCCAEPHVSDPSVGPMCDGAFNPVDAIRALKTEMRP